MTAALGSCANPGTMGVKVRFRRGAYWLFIDHKGQRKAKRVGPGPAGKQAAELAAVKIAARLAEGGPLEVAAPPPSPSVKDAAEAWLARVPALRSFRPGTTAIRRHYLLAHIVPFFDGRALNTLTREDCENLVLAKRAPGGTKRGGKGMRDETVKAGLLPALRGLLDFAVSRGWLAANPLRDREPIWRPAPRPPGPDQSAPFVHRELVAILDAAAVISPVFGLLVRCWAQSGMRSGELRALTWADYDATAGMVMVMRTRTHGRTGPTKTPRSQRLVRLTHPVCEATAAWRPGSTPESVSVLPGLAAVVPLSLSSPLFPSLKQPGRHLDEAELRALWGRVLRRAGVRYRPAETLRHTFVSTLLSRGAPLLYVSAQSGHSAMIMLKHYAKWIPQEAHPTASPAQPTPWAADTNSAPGQRKTRLRE